jgi:hypothetical protein
MVPPSAATPSSLGQNFPVGIDVDAALRWSVMQQGEAIEAGGFRGRSNKLVDGCYSWWVGGGVPVVEALARREKAKAGTAPETEGEPSHILMIDISLRLSPATSSQFR